MDNLIKKIVNYFNNYDDCFCDDCGIKKCERDFVENYIIEQFSNRGVQWVAGKEGMHGSYSLRSNFIHIRKGHNDKYCTVTFEGESTLEFIASFDFFKNFNKFKQLIRELEINELREARYYKSRSNFLNSIIFKKVFLYEITKTR